MTSPEGGLQVRRTAFEPGRRGSVVARARQFFAETEGAALIEYGLIVLLIAALCIILLQSIGSKVSNGFNSANAAIP